MPASHLTRLLPGLLLTGATGLAALDADLQTIGGRLAARLQDAVAVAGASAAAQAAALGADGRWPDIRYDDASRGGWNPAQHLRRLVDLARAWSAPQGKVRGDPKVAAAIHAGLAWWLANDPQSPNWWHNQINNPQCLGQLLILCGPELSADERSRSLVLISRAKIGMTGQNLVWLSGNVLMQAIIRDDPALARQARNAINATIVIDPGAEGLQADYSFHQHGPQLQTGNYGLAFAADAVGWLQALAGTGLALDPAKAGIVRDYLLQGVDPMTWKGRLDISACGRQLFPGAPASKGAATARALEALAQGDPAAAPACRAALAAYDPAAPPETRTASDRMYWRSDILVDRRPGYYASVRMSSPRIKGTEEVNSENLRGALLGDGAMFLYRSGREYEDIFPVWDWTRLPGVTASERTRTAPQGALNAGAFTGGVSDGHDGAAALTYDRELAGEGGKGRTRAAKAWFCVDGRIVCLGSGIASTLPGAVRTSVEQRLLAGPVQIGTAAGATAAERGAHPVAGLQWAWHDGVGYAFPGGTTATVALQAQKGAWKEVFQSGKPAPVELDVFSLWLDHGEKAADAAYAYVVLPGFDAAATAAWAAKPDVEILANRPELQAMRCGAVAAAVFRKPGELPAFPGGLAVDRPCLVLLGQGGGLSVADPAQESRTVTVTWKGHAIPVTMPEGQFAGRSVAVRDQ